MTKVDGLLAWLIPRRCVLCNQPGSDAAVCAGCRDDLPWLGLTCDGCGAPLPTGIRDGPCARCGATRKGDCRVLAALRYEFPVDRMITGAKFHRQLHFAWALGELLALAVERDRCGRALPDLLVPVPLHRRRLSARGYNQALEIARPVAARLRLELAPAACERIKPTAEQTGLPAAERRRNLRDAFVARPGCRGARIAVLDDVITTGSTAAAVVAAFHDAGAAGVDVWAAARAL